MRSLIVVATIVGISGVVACTADPYGGRPGNGLGTDASETCSTKTKATEISGVDPKAFKECKGSKGTSGRCVPSAALGDFKDTFEKASCKSSEACVPDDLVAKGTDIELTSCTAVLNAEGRCFWPLAKDIAQNYDMLKGATKDQCPDDMVCAPCVHPLTKEETGVCKLNSAGGSKGSACGSAEPGDAPGAGGSKGMQCPQVEPIVDTASFKAEDCGSNMLCVPANLTGDNAKNLKDCKGGGKCAPKKAVERGGNYVPKTCRSTNNAEGRCTNVAIPQVAAQASILPKDGCDADERCAPCFDPRDGKETGACRSAPCDQPKEAAKKFASCCGGKASCVPTSAVPADSVEMLAKDTCSGDAPLCAPNEFVGTATPRSCQTVFGLVQGVCLPKCAVEHFAEDLVQGTCTAEEMCAPCMALPEGTCK